jgi:sterol desaturase/sphingolipid hydroxylase (fatty acid hydroxylase superfamily)
MFVHLIYNLKKIYRMNKKLIYFTTINTTFNCFGYLLLIIKLYNSILLTYLFSLCKNILFTYTLDRVMKDKNRINNKSIQHNTNTVNIMTNISLVSLTDTASIFICSYYVASLPQSIILFIPSMFAYELVFDFFHYWTHRMCHHKYLYWIHKQHHQDTYDLNVYSTFNQHPLDLLLTNVLPMYLTSNIIPLTDLNFMTFMLYKSYIEISGHTGLDVNSSSFPQCMWVSKLLNIELYMEDHYDHHIKYNYNYSKRFSVWDRAFGTYYQNENVHKKNKYEKTFFNKMCGIGLLITPLIVSYYGFF